jgi:hypothetical protein
LTRKAGDRKETTSCPDIQSSKPLRGVQGSRLPVRGNAGFWSLAFFTQRCFERKWVKGFKAPAARSKFKAAARRSRFKVAGAG